MCNILNQNPDFWATSTSPLPGFVSTIVSAWSGSIEVKAELNEDKDLTEAKLERCLKVFIEAWSERKKAKTIFDKSRGWGHNNVILKSVFPDAKIIVCVRDPRAVYASVEKQHRNTGLLDEAKNVNEKTVLNRASNMFSNTGLIGLPLEGVEDLIRRNPKGVIFVKFEDLIRSPEIEMRKIYEGLGLDYFEHDFDKIKNTANDPDGLYLWKYPHVGEGKVEKQSTDEWKKFVSDDVAQNIMSRCKNFNEKFGYGGEEK